MKYRICFQSLLVTLCALLFLTGCSSSPIYPLHSAVVKDDIANVAKLVTEQKIDLNATNDEGETPMGLAATDGNIDIMKLLVQNGVSVDVRSAYSWTALMDAAASGQIEAVQWLIEQDCDTCAQTNMGATALYIAAYHKQDRIVELILKKDQDSIDLTTNSGHTPLMAGCASLPEDKAPIESEYVDRQIRVIEQLMAAGADINARNDTGKTALHIMAEDEKHPECLMRLLGHQADLSVMDNFGYLPIHIAVTHENQTAFEAMLRKSASIIPHETRQWITARMHHLYAGLLEKDGNIAQAQEYYTKVVPMYQKAIEEETALMQATQEQINDLVAEKITRDLLGHLVAAAGSAASPNSSYYYMPGHLNLSGLKDRKKICRMRITQCEMWLQECQTKANMQSHI